MITFLGKRQLRWYGHVLRKEGRGYHQEDVKHASAGKEEKGVAQEETAGQHQRSHETLQDDERLGTESKCVVHEDKVRPITTWRCICIDEKVRNCSICIDEKVRNCS